MPFKKFRHRPTIVEAAQYNPPDEPLTGIVIPNTSTIGILKTNHGYVNVRVGQWVIKGVGGEYYPASPSVFVANYQAVEEDA